MSDTINRRRALAGIGVGLASVAASPGAAHSNDDTELRRLWALYREQRAIERTARAHLNAISEAWQRAAPKEIWQLDNDTITASRDAWGVNEAYDEWSAHYEEVRARVRAIRAADASTLFGIGVKLAAMEGEDETDDSDEAINDALRQLARLTGEATFADMAAKFWAWDRTSGDEEDAA
jgi:hypothetical protein